MGRHSRVTMSFVMLAMVIFAGCATTATIRNAPLSAGNARMYRVDFETLTRFAREAVLETGLGIVQYEVTPDGCAMIIARKDMSAWSSGELVRVLIEGASDKQSRVTVYTQKVVATQVLAKGDYSPDIFSRIDLKISRVARADYQYPAKVPGRIERPSKAAVTPPLDSKTTYRPIPPSKAAVAPPLDIETTHRPVPRSVDFGHYHALVIGIVDYQHLPALKTAVNDARAITELLKKEYGFKVKLLLNATRSDILTALGEYREVLTERDNILIYYAGHGWLDEAADEGYWLPADATKGNDVNWISNSTITAAVRAMQAKHVIVVADSCYAGKLARGLHIKRKTPDYLARITRKKARVVLSSGGLEPVADSGGQGEHSVFASAFVKVLQGNKGVLEGTELFSRIRRPVMVNSDQTPEYADIRKAGHEGGDFLFIHR